MVQSRTRCGAQTLPGARMGTKNKSNATCPPVPRDGMSTRRLLAFVQERLSDMPPFEMREVDHSLCETDKHMRLLLGEGKSKRKFNGAVSHHSAEPLHVDGRPHHAARS